MRFLSGRQAVGGVILAWVLVVVAPGCSPTVHTQALTGLPGVNGFNNIDFTQSQEFKDQKVARDHIQSIKADFVRLKITSPISQDYGFLDSLAFYAETSGQPDLLIAQKDGISKLGLTSPNPTLELDIPDAELLPYVTAPSMSITVKGQGRAPPQDVTLHATVGVRAVLKLF